MDRCHRFLLILWYLVRRLAGLFYEARPIYAKLCTLYTIGLQSANKEGPTSSAKTRLDETDEAGAGAQSAIYRPVGEFLSRASSMDAVAGTDLSLTNFYQHLTTFFAVRP